MGTFGTYLKMTWNDIVFVFQTALIEMFKVLVHVHPIIA